MKKLRLANWYDGRHRNTGPPLFMRQAAKRHLEELGLSESDHKIPLKDFRRWGTYDINLWVDFGEDGLPEEYVPIPGEVGTRIYWSSDSHLGMDYRLRKASEADYVFTAIQRHVPIFKEYLGHDNVWWLPHAGEPTCYMKKHVQKRYDVCFIGHLPTDERIELLDKLFAEFPDFYYGQKFFEEANQKYCESKIVFNHCIGDEANMRVFEGTLSGSLVLCSYNKDVEDLGYIDGENIAFYSSPEEMIEKARYYVENNEEREFIAEAGRLHTLNNHTYLHRVKHILNTVKGGLYGE